MDSQNNDMRQSDRAPNENKSKKAWVEPKLTVIDVIERTMKIGATPPSDGGFKQS